MINKKLIFDLGFYNGDDTAFYLKKGYSVVAVEATSSLVEKGKIRFADEIATGELVLINKAISDSENPVAFYIHKTEGNLSSLHEKYAGDNPEEILVETTSYNELSTKYGTPHYMKVDIEGMDTFVARQLKGNPPEYVSFELSRTFYKGIVDALRDAGYTKYQLVNQMLNPSRNPMFTDHSSGFFGKDLPADKWLPVDEMLSRYEKYNELRSLDPELSLGWIDLHAAS